MQKMPYYICFVLLFLLFSACKNEKVKLAEEGLNNSSYSKIENTLGFGVLQKACGIWNGPVTSTTPLGGYPEWIVDFRPIAENQISSMNELDTLNDIHMSFFVAKLNGEYKICFRNGGSFAGQTRVSYFIADSVSESETNSFYRFKEIVKGKKRAFTDVIFKTDSLIINSYTNKYNSLSESVLHMSWKAKKQDETSFQAAKIYFDFPKKTLSKDLSTSFDGLTEAIFYSIGSSDPYPSTSYLGACNFSYTYSSSISPVASKKSFLILSTQALFSGMLFNSNNLKFRSRYIVLHATDTDFSFKKMHPGNYYAYVFYDSDGNQTINSGDWISTTNTQVEVKPDLQSNVNVNINFQIP